MALLVLGVLVSAFMGKLDIVAPVVQASPSGAPDMWPFLFITIACGAISGFHSLVSSGTSAKQVRSESDSLFVGYGSMLMEGTLSTLVIIAVSAGIGMGYVTKAGETLTGIPAWTTHYASWAAAAGLGSKVAAFVDGSANMIASIGLSKSIALAIMGVFVASFAGTTLDTATRIQRYVLSELFGDLKLDFLTGKYIATFIAVITALILAFATGANGTGALKLWPLFGATNQTLAALALLIISIYLKNRGGLGWLLSGIPMAFMAVMTIWALVENQTAFGTANNMLLQVINIIILLVALWIVIEGVIKLIVPGGEATPTEEAA
jgi:carbon starvation protein